MMAGYHSIRPHEPTRKMFKTEKAYLKARNLYLRRLREYEEDNRRIGALAMTMSTIFVLAGSSMGGFVLFRLGSDFGFLKIGAVALTLISIYLFFYRKLGEG